MLTLTRALVELVNTVIKNNGFLKNASVRELAYRPHLGCGVGQPCEVSNTSRRTIKINMVYNAVVIWTWHHGGYGKEMFENVDDAIKRYKELNRNPQAHNLSIVY